MADSPETDDDMLPEYDLRSMPNPVRGKYAERYGRRLRFIRIETEIAHEFADEAAVNAALREYLRLRDAGLTHSSTANGRHDG